MSQTSPNPQEIKNLFGNISKTYDRANDVITLGMAHSWRRKLVDWSETLPGQSVLDCASGTGDLAIEFKKVVGDRGRVVATDFCSEMLELTPQKAKKNNIDIEVALADVTQLPYEDNQFNVVSIAYGIRNVSDPHRALCEMARVSKRDGYVMILETGQVTSPLLGPAINVYFRHVVPTLGGLVSGQPDAYKYLNESSSKFPCKEEFIKMMEKTGKFKKLEYKTLMGGASYIYKGTVI